VVVVGRRPVVLRNDDGSRRGHRSSRKHFSREGWGRSWSRFGARFRFAARPIRLDIKFLDSKRLEIKFFDPRENRGLGCGPLLSGHFVWHKNINVRQNVHTEMKFLNTFVKLVC
jgi:hypothetical protein